MVLGAALLAGELLSAGAIFGIGLVSAGLIGISVSGGVIGKIRPLALRGGLATSLLIASYTVADVHGGAGGWQPV